MDDRRTFLALATAFLPVSLITLSAQAPSAPTASGPRGDLARHTLTGPLADFDVVLQELHPPVGDGREHRHTGPILGYVLEGKVKFAVNHEPARIYGVGEIFFEETGALHSTWGSVEGSLARVLAFMVLPKGSNGAAPIVPANLTTLSAQAPSAAPDAIAPRELARHTLTGPLADFDALLIELRPPAGEGREHRHTGPVLGYVLEGKVRFGVNHEPARTFGVGETFFEETGALHSTFGSVEGAPARVIVFMVVPKATNGAAPRA